MNTRLALICILAIGSGNSAMAGGGVGVLGDSYSDEYQFYSPHRNTARGWVEILAKTRGVNFGEFRASSWGEPRNQGFAYNWARSGATSANMIASGQHHGLAEQVRSGEVGIAVIFVGGNDFIEALHASNPKSALSGLGDRVANNVKIATDAILAASPNAKVLAATVPDVRGLPEFRDALQKGKLSPALAALAVSEVEIFNDTVRKLAKPGSRVAIFDFANVSRISLALFPKAVVVAGRKVDRELSGNSADRLFLADRRHLGTMGQGMLAKILVDVLNKKCGAAIKPLEEREIVELADSLIAREGVAEASAPRDEVIRRVD